MGYNQTETMRSAAVVFPLLALAQLGLAADTRVADAAMAHNHEAMKTLVAEKADVNAAQPDGTTALDWAVSDDNVTSADLLIKAGADVKAANRFGATPLSLAATNGNAVIIGK